MAQRRIYTIWVVGADGKHKEWAMPDQVLDGLRAEYPMLKLGNELTRMHTWTVRNASKRWGEETVMRGVVRWLNRAKAAKARIVAEKQGRVIFGEPAIKRAYEPGKPPPEAVRAELAKYTGRGW